jgi:hypothetical protein
MVGLSGLEPPTSRLSGVRSNQLSYRPSSNVFYRISYDHVLQEEIKNYFYGAGDGNRTHIISLEG